MENSLKLMRTNTRCWHVYAVAPQQIVGSGDLYTVFGWGENWMNGKGEEKVERKLILAC